ncbi:UDP-3-O-(3-hydroxymyristoyl)glucosamine N-acyltransferase [Paracoccus sp. (in: a-proteobacteria)]|uniref:UDP-3-O-(3-hydroxymyristoyl)glucosamine N-acyltransferase n=1 Tax=Paracoccus sp. TaxID=267 RepID=UPI0026DEF2E2|nr:UDP-3-O-(3-hydroxymyristoyl)glucosamine N-acyltransferase [Paracoccus sp. (in: a-proteobacteria)]MDO5370223.1 UDP-3-O-(3-hydroxymyristoyl)glucosamine N-acyltransferase [Paracoccus sp. (in: a-proteobacteria)]
MTITLAELAQALGARLWGDGALRITGAAEPAQAGPAADGSAVIATAMAPQYASSLAPGAAALISEGMDPEAMGLAGAVIVARPRLAMAGLTQALDRGPRIAPGIHPSAVIDPSAEIGEGAAIGPFVVIGAGVRLGVRARIDAHVTIGADAVLGDDALLHAGVRIAHGVTAGARLIVQPGAVIGGDGFSFVTPEVSGVEEIRHTLGHRGEVREQHWVRIHSLGGVTLGDDVEIGANSTIDRGTIRATSIGSGTKIDSLVQIGHNVRIGRDCLLCGMAGVAGSARIGDRVVLAGKAAVNDNIFVGDDVIAGGASNIFTNVPAGRVILGSPAVKMETQIEINKAMRRLPRMAAQFAELQKTVTRLMQKD